jgi:hypothetical protein
LLEDSRLARHFPGKSTACKYAQERRKEGGEKERKRRERKGGGIKDSQITFLPGELQNEELYSHGGLVSMSEGASVNL